MTLRTSRALHQHRSPVVLVSTAVSRPAMVVVSISLHLEALAGTSPLLEVLPGRPRVDPVATRPLLVARLLATLASRLMVDLLLVLPGTRCVDDGGTVLA